MGKRTKRYRRIRKFVKSCNEEFNLLEEDEIVDVTKVLYSLEDYKDEMNFIINGKKDSWKFRKTSEKIKTILRRKNGVGDFSVVNVDHPECRKCALAYLVLAEYEIRCLESIGGENLNEGLEKHLEEEYKYVGLREFHIARYLKEKRKDLLEHAIRNMGLYFEKNELDGSFPDFLRARIALFMDKYIEDRRLNSGFDEFILDSKRFLNKVRENLVKFSKLPGYIYGILEVLETIQENLFCLGEEGAGRKVGKLLSGFKERIGLLKK